MARPAAPKRRRPERAEQYESGVYRDLQVGLAASVRRLRDERGWIHEEAAHRCGMTTRLLQRVDGQEVNLTFTSLARFCECFGADVAQFFKPRR
ncbi:helix-turn-helix transcriptional regulator [Myxococcaceae bacterium GXIMD 01537]